MKQAIILVCLLLVGITIGAPVCKAQDEPLPTITHTTRQASTPLVEYLVALGNKYHCFFTLEQGWDEQDIRNQLKLYRVENFGIDTTTLAIRQGSVEEVLNELSSALPNFSYIINASNPKIIHIIDRRLQQQKNYGLNKALTNFHFQGTVYKLTEAINKEESLVAPTNMLDTYEAMTVDYKTPVQAEVTSLTIREVLSNFIKLKHHSPLLWIASTQLVEDGVSHVHFVL